jgi:hypothetical protein
MHDAGYRMQEERCKMREIDFLTYSALIQISKWKK